MSGFFVASASERVTQLLVWWQAHGRKDPALKPWMFRADGTWPAAEEVLNPYGIWIAEVMRCSAA